MEIWFSAGEHVLSAADIERMYGQEDVFKFRQSIRDKEQTED